MDRPKRKTPLPSAAKADEIKKLLFFFFFFIPTEQVLGLGLSGRREKMRGNSC